MFPMTQSYRYGISFVVIALNEEKYIEDCIRSINSAVLANQSLFNSFLPYEIIVVDNGSDDHTWVKAARENCRVLFEPKKGMSLARKTGFSATSYEYCAFLDADVRIDSNWITEALTSLKKEGVVAVSGPERFYDVPAYVNLGTKSFYLLARLFHLFWPTVQGGNYIAKKTALLQINPFDTSRDFWGEDSYTASQLKTVGKIILNPRMIAQASGRRLMKDGPGTIALQYIVNYLSVYLLNKKVNFKHEPYR